MKGILSRIASFSVCVSLLASCTLDPYEIPAKEEYTRNFIKEFGLIDPNQNFNLAQSSSVTVKLDSPAREVKAYMKVDGTYWLVASLNDVSGTFNIPFDMPPLATDVLVKIDGKRYHTTPGGTVNLAPASRSILINGTDESGAQSEALYKTFETTSTINGSAVSITASNTTHYAYFNSLSLGPVNSKDEWKEYYDVSKDIIQYNTAGATGILPESDKSGAKQENIEKNYSSRLSDNNIWDDFLFDAAEVNGKKRHFTMYPMYWDTGQPNTTLGVYIIDTDNNIHHFPIYNTKRYDGDIEEFYPANMYDSNKSNLASSASGSGTATITEASAGSSGGGETPAVTTATKITCTLYVDVTTWDDNISEYQSGYFWNGSKYIIDKSGMDEYVWSYLSSVDKFQDWYDKRIKSDDIFTISPVGSTLDPGHNYKLTGLESIIYNDGTRWEATATFELVESTPQSAKSRNDYEVIQTYTVNKEIADRAKQSDNWGKPYIDNYNNAFAPNTEMLLRSRGVDVTIEGYDHEFGMYIEFGTTRLYSQRALNVDYAGGIRYPDDERGREVFGDKAGTLASSFAASYLHPVSRRLLFSFEDWTGSGSDGDLNDLVFMFNGITKIVTTEEEITIPDPEPGTPEPIVEEPYHWLLAVEDLGATDDFDFNDIVISISASLTTETPATGAKILGTPKTTSDGQKCYNKVVYKALAAGGTKSAYVYFNGMPLYPDGHEDLAEWHKWFDNGRYSSTTMINTGYGTDNCTGAECTIYYGVIDEYSTDFIFSLSQLNPEYEAIDAVNSGFKIGIDDKNADAGTISTDYFTTDENGYYIQPTAPGEAPQMFLIPDRWNNDGSTSGTSAYDTGKWQWPMEQHHIQSCYGDFKKWVSGDKDGDTWYQKAGSGTCRPSK